MVDPSRNHHVARSTRTPTKITVDPMPYLAQGIRADLDDLVAEDLAEALVIEEEEEPC
jgi:uncharacterized protein YukJ